MFTNLIRPSSVIAPKDAAQMFYLMKERYGFFNGPEWESVEVDPQTWKISGLEQINENQNFQEQEKIKHVLPQEVAEAASGEKMPEFKSENALDKPSAKKQSETMEQETMEMENQIDNAIKEFEKFKPFIDFCSSQAAYAYSS